MDRKINGDVKNVGKGSKEETLSSRFARADFTGGSMDQRYMNNYAKKPPKTEMYGPAMPSMSMGRFF